MKEGRDEEKDDSSANVGGGDGGDGGSADIPALPVPQEGEAPAGGGKDASGRKGADNGNKATPCSEKLMTQRQATMELREDAATAREGTAGLRENAASLREDAAGLREEAAGSREHLARLSEEYGSIHREANAKLVLSLIEAHKLAEEVQAGKAELDYLAHHDVLTGLPNRLLFRDRLSKAIELARRQNERLAVLFMDLDKFKYINDSLGHGVGDDLLKSVARRLESCMRRSDTVSRQGGDEFILLLSHIAQPEDAAVTAGKILAALAPPHLIDQQELHISASIGISIYPEDGTDAEALTKSADTAMYNAKENGRDNYKFFEQEMNARAIHRQSIEASLRRALACGEFVLHYQPKIDLQSHMIVGVEALIRWQHPKLGLVPPLQFLPIAEDCGLILPIGRWVLREACLQAHAWRQAGLPPIAIAVNTSALEFRDKNFLENTRATLGDTGLEPHYLEFELTESVLMQDGEFTNSMLRALTDLGVKLAIDDFGTGYSSLSYLRRFPIDALKIDRSFVNGVTSSPDDAAIVSAVIGMGKSLKLRVVAEGVETPEQCEFLLAQHCDEGQGYYFSRPVAAKDIAALLQTGVTF
jgi:diguanylate cyclase (GGDEF)-like protein